MLHRRWTRLFSLALVSALPLGALGLGCSSSGTGTVGQMISCKDTGAGVTDCHPVTAGSTGSGSGSDTCEDVDDDGDGTPHDEGEETHGMHTATADRNHDGTPDTAENDDDGDGIPNDRDCDKRHGGDDDGSGDDGGSGDHDGSGSGAG